MKAGRLTGVRADLAFAQSIVETGHFAFPSKGQLTRKDNNFAGIGACDSCKTGWKFSSAMAGVLAQEQLLQAYATPIGYGSDVSPLAGGVRGCCTTWLALSGVWASNPYYGYEILGIYKEMLDWAIPRQLLQDGLISPASFEQEEAQLPAEDARTYALVAGAISSGQAANGAPGAGCPTSGADAGKDGHTSTSTQATTSSTAPTASTTGPTTTTIVPNTAAKAGVVPASCAPAATAVTGTTAVTGAGATSTTGPSSTTTTTIAAAAGD